MSTDGSGNNTLNAGVIKSNTGSNTGLTIASDGQITVNQNNPTIQLGSNTTFSDGLIEEQTVIKYAFANNGAYTNQGTTEKVATRKDGDDTAVESISVIGGYTYIYTYNYWCEIWRNSGGHTSQRYGKIKLVDDSTTRTQGDTSFSGTLAYGWVGRNMYATQGSSNTTYVFTSIRGSSYYSSNDTRYVFLTTEPPVANHRLSLYMDSTYPLHLVITKIKGNVLTTRSA